MFIAIVFSLLLSLVSSLRLHMSDTSRPSYSLLPPAVNLPKEMYSNQPGTWAYDTMSRRVHEDILPRIIDDNADLLGNSSLSLFVSLSLSLVYSFIKFRQNPFMHHAMPQGSQMIHYLQRHFSNYKI